MTKRKHFTFVKKRVARPTICKREKEGKQMKFSEVLLIVGASWECAAT